MGGVDLEVQRDLESKSAQTLLRTSRLRRSRKLLWIAAVAFTTAVFVSLGAVTTSGSLPRGLYLRFPRGWVGRRPAPGDLVLACAPADSAGLARRRGYLGSGPCDAGSAGHAAALGKVVVAVEGDDVEMRDDGIEVNGRRIPSSRPLAVDRAGRLLSPYLRGRLRLGRGEVWLYAPHPRSFDSRYFGPVGDRAVLAFLVPIATDGNAATFARLASFHRAAPNLRIRP
jgi:conjugative transfer signal peptidase TraF